MDGLSSLAGSGARLILASLKGNIAKYALLFKFLTTNDEATYETLTSRLQMEQELGVQCLKFCNDLQLIVR